MIKQTLNLTTSNSHYLSDFLTDLPDNCFFNKVLCGAGGTHLALTNSIPYVIVVPTTELITNKISQHPSVIGVFGSYNISNLYTAVNNGATKIMVTYKSLPKVVDVLEKTNKLDQFKLLIDEAHMLTEGDDKDFMHSEVSYILRNFTKFSKYCFMTATPYPEESMPEQLLHLPLVTAEWSGITPVNLLVQRIVDNKFQDYVLKLCIDYLEGTLIGNPYFFYNSVEAITQIVFRLIKAGYCTLDDVRIICSDRNNEYLNKYLSPTFNASPSCSEAKKLNFITAKAFEGADIYDEDGVTYICADGNKTHTRLEISTKIPQIVNRIRNSKYKQNAFMLYTQSFTKDARTKEEYLEIVRVELEKAGEDLELVNELLKRRGAKYLNKKELDVDEYLTTTDDGTYITNVNAGKRALALWESANNTYYYKSDTISELESRNTTSLINIFNGEDTYKFELPSALEKVKLGGKKANFTKMCKEFLDAIEQGDEEKVEFIEMYDEIFKQARKVFKYNLELELSACSFQRSKLEKRLKMAEEIASEELSGTVLSYFKVGEKYEKDRIKNIFEKLYDHFGIKKTAKSTDIKRYFNVKASCTKGVNYFTILNKL